MGWRKGSVLEEGKRFGENDIALTIALAPAMSADEGWDNAYLSFISLPLSSQSAASMQCPSSYIESFTTGLIFTPSPQGGVLGPSYDSTSSSVVPPLMHSLLPSPFSSSSLSSFFPAHVATHHCVEPSSLPSSCGFVSRTHPSTSPSGLRWRQRNSEVGLSSPENVMRLSSLASLATSLPSFSSAENPFVVEAKEDQKVSRGRTEQDAGDSRPLIRNLMERNARPMKKTAPFFGLNLRVNRPQNVDRAAKRNDDDDSQAVQGSSNEKRAETIREGQRKAIQTSKHLLAGAVAAMVSRTIVAPLERLKLEYLVRGAKGNVVDTLRAIFRNEGMKGFWKGNCANLLRTAPFKSINFFAYDNYRRQLLRWGDRTEVSNIERLAAGAAAGVTATILCFPLDTVRTLVVAPGGEALGGMIGCFHHLIQTEGFLGLYKGLLPAVVSMAPSGAVFYGVYDMLKSAYLTSPEGKEMMQTRRRRAEENPEETSTELELGPFRTLLFGALAGACAETVTYPLEVVRRAQQMQRMATKLGMVGTIQGLLRKGGVGALYAGILPSTMQVLPSAALSYFVYETVKLSFKIPP